MAVLESAQYAKTREALKGNLIMQAMLARDLQCVAIQDMSDAELAEAHIARRDEDGGMVHDSAFMNAANRRFRELEDANPAHKFTGPMHIGAVAEVILSERDRMTVIRRKLLRGLARQNGKDYPLADDATPGEVKEMFMRALDDAAL